MTGWDRLDRRAVLRLLAWWAALGAGGGGALARTPDPPAAPWLAHRRSVVAIGRRYLAAHPHEADPEALARALELPSPDLGTPPADRERHGQRLLRAHRKELREGRSVELAGWVLSRTEVRLAALVALQAEP